MKKLAIAGASAVLAALPVVGVFAADLTPVVDTVQVTVNSSCAMTTNGSGAASQAGGFYTATVAAGTLVTPGGTGTNVADWSAQDSTPKTITFSCNDAGGWKVTAQDINQATSEGASPRTTMNGGTTGKTIATGTATSGSISNWAFKVTGGNGVTIANDFDDWSEVPGSTPGVVAQSTNNAPISGGTITPSYQVWISTTQEADTYTGYVKYVLTAPLS